MQIADESFLMLALTKVAVMSDSLSTVTLQPIQFPIQTRGQTWGLGWKERKKDEKETLEGSS